MSATPKEKAKRFTVWLEETEGRYLECKHCHRSLSDGDYAFRTSKGVYCSTTCKMWHEGQA